MKAVFIRHGEPNYENVGKWGKIGLGYELGPLSELGVEQANKRAKDPYLKDADLIVSSPYTRALHTAAIISKETNIPLVVEEEIHEWFSDVDFIYKHENVYDVSSDYFKLKGIRTDDHEYNWERYETIKKRVMKVVEKYKKYDKVLFVCHGIVMTTITFFEDEIEHCGIREIEI